MTTTSSQSLAMSTPQAAPTPQEPDCPESIPAQENSLSPEWTDAITNLLRHPLTSETGQMIWKWIFYQSMLDHTDIVILWDPIEFGEDRNLQKYEDSNGYLRSNTVKQLSSLMNYMMHLISQDRPANKEQNHITSYCMNNGSI